MLTPRCPACGGMLTTEKPAWRCAAGHSYDVARQGYVNLLPVGQKHSLHPGDTREMVAARRAFLDAGYYAPIAQAVCRCLQQAGCAPETILDVGCGEGYYLAAVGAQYPQAQRWGVDISKEAVRCAAARDKAARWLVASAAHLPFAERSFSCLLSMFALTEAQEFARVLQPNGVFLQVIAGEEHLMGLKRIIYPEIHKKEKILQRKLPQFTLEHSQTLNFSFTLPTQQAVQHLLYMTPHVWRISKAGADALAQTTRLCDTAQVVLNVYRAKEQTYAGKAATTGK